VREVSDKQIDKAVSKQLYLVFALERLKNKTFARYVTSSCMSVDSQLRVKD